MRGGCVNPEKCLHFCSLCTRDNKTTNGMFQHIYWCSVWFYVLKLTGRGPLSFGTVLCIKDTTPTSLSLSCTVLQRDIITPSADSVFGKSPASFPVMAEMAFHGWNMTGASYLTNIDLVLWQKLSHGCYKTQKQKNWNVSIHQVLTIMGQNKND